MAYCITLRGVGISLTGVGITLRGVGISLTGVGGVSLHQGTPKMTKMAHAKKAHSEWKKATITALFKKVSRNKPDNYRPVSLTSVVCKLLETLIRDHMAEILVKHKLINTSQHDS